MKVGTLKTALRENDYAGDRWGVAMGAFFDVAAHAFEKNYVLPEKWGYQVGAAGNVIEDSFLDAYGLCEADPDELIILGEYLYRLTEILRKTDHSY